MYIIQLSDLHFHEKETAEDERYLAIIENLIKNIKDTVPTKSLNRETLLIAVCGDLINEGAEGGLDLAKKSLNTLRSRLASSYEILFGFAPGNHDLVNNEFDAFKEFISEYNNDSDNYNSRSCYCISLENTDVIFINSIFSKDIKKGKINYDDLSKLLGQLDKNTSKILVLHHTIISMDDGDTSSILNAAQLITLIEQYNVALLLHGHTHALDTIFIGTNSCAIVGVGALFSRNYADVNSQFNLIEYQEGNINAIHNFTYHFDRKSMDSKFLSIPDKLGRNIFNGQKISDAYNQLMLSLKTKKRLYNVHIFGRYRFEDFEADVNKDFGKIKDFEFSYSALAEKWQNCLRPDELYFSHGEYYYNKELKKEGILYIIDTLKRKPTSSRAVLSTLSMKNIDGEEDYFLPSLMVIQFGFDRDDRDTLIVSMYLRALEASRFLKINICEILYLAKQIKRAIPFKNIDINISAFRVQNEEEFSCFIKSKLDKLPSEDIQEIVRKKDIKTIIEWLEEKRSRTETVVVSKGMEELLKKIRWVNSVEYLEHYDDSVLNAVEDVVSALENIRKERNDTSIYDDLDETKEIVRKQIGNAVDLLKKYL